MKQNRYKLLLFAPGREFVAPYVMQSLPDWDVLVLSGADVAGSSLPAANAAVMLSGTEVYDIPDAGAENVDESGDVNCSSKLYKLETTFLETCNRDGIRHLVLRCANTVGTGMTGLPMEFARWIYRGWLMHFPGNEARISVVHACDVAGCVASFARKSDPLLSGAVLNITDADNPTVHDFLEALAYRMNQKRISVLGTRPQQWIAARIYGRRKMHLLTTTVTFDGSKVRSMLGVGPVKVTDYLFNHIYDHSSL